MNLYTVARTWQTIRAILPGGPRASTRVKNIAVGRVAARGGIWRRLWGPWFVLMALTFPATALPADLPPPPFVISFSGDVKPLPWHLQNSVGGKVVAW